MVKLASARESRMYGPRPARNRAEYINAALYLFATVLLLGGFVAQLSVEPKPGLVLLLIGLALIIVVNLHDLMAHLAGIDYRLRLMEYDAQLALVEFAVPIVQTVGSILCFLGILFLFLGVFRPTSFVFFSGEGLNASVDSILHYVINVVAEKGHGYYKFEQHALNLLIAGAVLWVVGSIHNSCQIYERADAQIQLLQESVVIPFFTASVLFLVGAILNSHAQIGTDHHGVELLSITWVWLGIFGSIMFFIGGITNVVKVFAMQQIEGLRLEKLRGGAQERLISAREGQVPLILDDQRRRKRQVEETVPAAVSTPYKDVLVGQP